MTDSEQAKAAENFSREWRGRGDEESDYQIFWLTLLRDVFGIEKPENLLKFQKHVQIDEHIGKIDIMTLKSKVLIEQKSFGVNLLEPSPSTGLTPYEQAKRYADNLPPSMSPRWIITCNFSEFQIYDRQEPFLKYIVENVQNFGTRKHKIFSYEEIMESKFQPVVIELKNLAEDYKKLTFLIDSKQEHLLPELKVSDAAVKSLKVLYDKFQVEYKKIPQFTEYLDDLNTLMVRLVYCFYASDSRIFKEKNQLLNYLQSYPEKIRNQALINLFSVLDCEKNSRDENLDDNLKNFPYLNGGLFAEKIKIPELTSDINNITAMTANEEILNDFKRFNWRVINPTIFGSMFESILNPELQRNQGMHYTSPENIHKVIDNLFLDDLYEKFLKIKRSHVKNRLSRLQEFQEKIADLKFLDPACGSGNFLTETYKSLRELENEILQEIDKLGGALPENPIKVSIDQFFGIEKFSYGVAIAKTALWIAEHQMLQETQKIIGRDIEGYLPLGKNENIHCANALQIDWSEVCPNPNFIIGNPPFVGARFMNNLQKKDMQKVFCGWRGSGNLDYVTAWYKKAADFIKDTKIECAFVSTDSICQGDSINLFWTQIFDEGIHIDFAWRSFKWQSESENMAQVYCVIVGFSRVKSNKDKIIFDGDNKIIAKNINGYLQDAQNFYIESRNNPICEVPKIGIGNKPIDDGNYLFTFEEMEDFLILEPKAKKFFKTWYDGQGFLNNRPRYCLWLGDCSEKEIKKMPKCFERVENVRRFRLLSKSKPTQKIACKPTRFHVENFPEGNYIVIPKVSSGERFYIPIGFLDDSVLCSDKLLIIPNANLFHFGVLESSVHMAWMRLTCMRLGTGYSYSNKIVYNNFVWCSPTAEQKNKIEQTAQKILDVRKNYPNSTLAALYNESTMPDDLRQAHLENDLAVMEAYGFDKNFSEEEIVSALMILYKNLTEKI